MAEAVKKKRILIYSLVFSPDGVSTAYLYNDLALGFQKRGYEVCVLTTTPHFNLIEGALNEQPLQKRFLGLFYQSDFNGIKVFHIPLKKHKSTLLRMLSFIYWHKMSFFVGLFLKRPDVILTPSPPLTSGLLAILLAKLKGAKTIYNVQEIYPDLLINLGHLKTPFLINFLKRLERFVYNSSNAVTTIDKQFYNIIKPRIKQKSSLHIIPNFVDTDLYVTKSSAKLPPEFLSKPGFTNMLYAGNIGLAQEWDLVLNLANEIREESITIWIIGEGIKKEYLKSQIQKHDLSNIKLLPYQDRKYMPAINLFADFHFIAMDKSMENEGFPSKVYSIMASGRPMVIVSSENTPITSFLSETDTSLLVTDHSLSGFKNAVLKLALYKELRISLGANGRKIIDQDYTKEKVINQYVTLFEKIVSKNNS
ncbi:glycosyltransferase family 4 protein [Flavobacteriaceae bacterium]|nr:glycosyltransferase family 4 protein [Flavobacteriaceae bacterium]